MVMLTGCILSALSEEQATREHLQIRWRNCTRHTLSRSLQHVPGRPQPGSTARASGPRLSLCSSWKALIWRVRNLDIFIKCHRYIHLQLDLYLADR